MKRSHWGIISCYLLALACLAGSIYQASVLLPLLRYGKRVEGAVVDIQVGVKGGKRAVLQFVTDTGDTVESPDLLEMMLIRFSRDDRVTVIYDPSNTDTATIDLGVWTWQEPAFFLFGFILLAVLGIVLPK